MERRQDHICSGRTCMFCRVLDNPNRLKQLGNRSYMDSQVLERVKELEQRSLLTTTENKMSMVKGEEIERLALLDTLTELYNSRTFLKEIKEELKRAKRYKRPVALCMVTVDNFKDISRQYGALTSDAVLKVIGTVLQGAVRDVDIPARYSAEEFAIIFPETNSSGAQIVAERIRQRIGSQAITHNWHNLKVTASVGLAAFPAHAREHDELVARSIQALEMAMQRGGDRVCSV
ncbi:MAG TPA: GGDEF domain-containing protein [Candidatus Melainabacteria bacterium]|nr:GGDEF domain-containing protein [Candidatus Melainabacteria bacterium]HIA54590.1 GGDEF domain-containing protein [Candidatus Melainabacteria bacterium]HIN67624.1 GGDEF domain-containing protein [Candidatus Obscuribacterales bacterium]